jgi:hypothetical protein
MQDLHSLVRVKTGITWRTDHEKTDLTPGFRSVREKDVKAV